MVNIEIILDENETMDDVNNFTFASMIFKQCLSLPELSARVIAEMLLLQWNFEVE